jgi:50S ribosomal protein L16 3-hydroxylase
MDVLVPGLASLVWPLTPEAFLHEHWQKRPLHVPGTPERLDRLTELFFGFSLEKILAAADLRRTIVQPPLSEQRLRSPRELLPEPMPEPATLTLLYELGCQLYIAASDVPGVHDWLEVLSQDLGRIAVAGRGDLYATRAGGGADTHFDQNDNFTIQLTGHKVWFYADEPYYPQPLHNSGALQGVPYDPTFVFEPARIDLAQLRQVVLGPGDVLYTPRGSLHGTRADEDSLSFNLSLGPQPWADLLLESLRPYLIRDSRLREGAAHDLETARARLGLLQELVAGLRPEDLVQAALPAGERLRRHPLSWWSCPDPGAAPCVLVEVHAPGRSTLFELSPELLPLLRALPDGPEPFSPELLPERDLIDGLVEAGLLSWV